MTFKGERRREREKCYNNFIKTEKIFDAEKNKLFHF